MSTGPRLYYEGYGSYGCPKNFLTIKPLKEVEKIIASLQNQLTKKKSTRASLCYYGKGSPDCPKTFFPIDPLKKSKKNRISRKFDNGENDLRIKSVL